jgi:hypothetical protein
LFLRIVRDSYLIVERSVAIISGALAKDQRANCVFSSLMVSQAIPAQRNPGSFHPPVDELAALILLTRKLVLIV